MFDSAFDAENEICLHCL